MFTSQGKCLARRTSHKQIYFSFEWSGVECVNILMPLVIRDIIICKVCFSTIIVYISCKLNFTFQSETLKGMFYCSYSTK